MDSCVFSKEDRVATLFAREPALDLMRRVPHLLLALILVLLGVAPVTAQDCFDEHEPNDTFGQALALPFDVPSSSFLCSGGDVDYFGVTLTAGQQIWI